MTPAGIAAYVMALTPKQVDRACAEDIMGWWLEDGVLWRGPEGFSIFKELFGPSSDRNQSRMVTVRIIETVGGVDYLLALGCALNTCLLSGDYFTLDGEVQILRVLQATPLDETRAALIAHMIHTKEESKT